MKHWPLAVPSMTTLDKLKIGYWLLKEDHWSAGEHVRAYEKRWEAYTGCPNVIMVSSGSAANFLIAQYAKHFLSGMGAFHGNKKVLFPAVNWISSISPWVQQGFEPVFMDVSANICSSSDQVAEALKKHQPSVLFYTTLLGMGGDLGAIKELCRESGTLLYLDNCESSFSAACTDPWRSTERTHFCNIATSSTSLYFSHHTSGNQEGGLIFCQAPEEANFYRMARNHGMTRGMPAFYRNPDVDPRFDFRIMGSNHRSTNLAAYMASLDLDRALAFSPERCYLSRCFTFGLDKEKFERPHLHLHGEVPLVLPIVAKRSGIIAGVKLLLDKRGIEWRPIVGGNMLRHSALKNMGNPADYPRAEAFHDNGVYIGLHRKVTAKMIADLVTELNVV